MEGLVFSPLTGLPIPEEYAPLRPVAVVVNNHSRALPQSGLSQAEIIYEVLAEGNITRLIAVFHMLEAGQIGPVRSTRMYFADVALNHDAIFVHHGGTPEGYARLANLSVDRMDGIALEGTVFWRDRTYPEWTGITRQRALEHSSYTSWQRISARMDSQEMRDYIGDGNFGFTFGEIPAGVQSAGNAEHILVPFSGYTRSFYFQPEYGHYIVHNRSGPHLDAETREPLITHNVLVQITQKRILDAIGYRAVTTVGEGRGYFAANGQFFETRWEKSSHQSPMRWYFLCGTPLVMTPGKTWVNVLQNTATVTME
jgi:hypothetical protein